MMSLILPANDNSRRRVFQKFEKLLLYEYGPNINKLVANRVSEVADALCHNKETLECKYIKE